MPVDDSSSRFPRLPSLPDIFGLPRSASARLPDLGRLPAFALPDPASVAVGAFNALLRREEWARERLLRHAGKTVRLAAGGFQASLTITSEGHANVADLAVVPNVTVTLATEKLTLAHVLSMRSSPDGDALMDITHISGDAGLAQVVGELARHLRWDIQDELATRIGDVPAMRLTQAAQALVHGARTAGQRLVGNVAEYLSEERRVLVGKPLFDDHCQELAQTVQALDALDARLKRLTRRTDRS